MQSSYLMGPSHREREPIFATTMTAFDGRRGRCTGYRDVVMREFTKGPGGNLAVGQPLAAGFHRMDIERAIYPRETN